LLWCVCRNDDDGFDDVDETSSVIPRRPQRSSPGERPTSIAERLSQLYESQETWKSKVEEKDVDQFTVEGKMNRLGQSDLGISIGAMLCTSAAYAVVRCLSGWVSVCHVRSCIVSKRLNIRS